MLFLILREAKLIRPNEKIAKVDGSGTEFFRALTSSIGEKLLNARPIPVLLLPLKDISIRVMSLRPLKPNVQGFPSRDFLPDFFLMAIKFQPMFPLH